MALTVPTDTPSFVESVFAAITSKSYDPKQAAARSLQATAPAFQPPVGPTGTHAQFGTAPAQPSRKRSFNNEWEGGDGQNGRGQQYGRGGNGDRPMKQMRRGGRGYEQRGGRPAPMPHSQGMPQMPTPIAIEPAASRAGRRVPRPAMPSATADAPTAAIHETKVSSRP